MLTSEKEAMTKLCPAGGMRDNTCGWGYAS